MLAFSETEIHRRVASQRYGEERFRNLDRVAEGFSTWLHLEADTELPCYSTGSTSGAKSFLAGRRMSDKGERHKDKPSDGGALHARLSADMLTGPRSGPSAGQSVYSRSELGAERPCQSTRMELQPMFTKTFALLSNVHQISQQTLLWTKIQPSTKSDFLYVQNHSEEMLLDLIRGVFFGGGAITGLLC